MELFDNLLPLKTKRLIIKKTTISNLDLLLKMDKQEITQKYLGGIKNKTEDERREFLNNKINNSNSLTIYLENKPIGFCELKFNNNKASLSYIFDNDYWNNGYCTEACEEIINICFNKLEINCILANTISDNKNSIRVLEKLGFKYQNSFIKNNITFLNYVIEVNNKKD